MALDPLSLYPAFYDNDIIAELGRDRKWSISDNTKMPVNVPALLETGLIRGASSYHLPTDAVTLDELTRGIPNASNCAYYFEAELSGLLLIDVEKTCPPDIAMRILGLADQNALYTETSMSGKGYHLITALPQNFYDFPASTRKAKIQEEHGYYEVLLTHWVTFTRKPIDTSILDEATRRAADDTYTLETFYADLNESAKGIASADNNVDLDMGVLSPDNYTDAQKRFDQRIREQALPIVESTKRKSLADFNNDTSRWEFSTMSLVLRRCAELIQTRLNSDRVDDTDPAYDTLILTPGHLVRVAYPIIHQLIPHREKHDGERNGYPYLVYQTFEAARIVDIPGLNAEPVFKHVPNGRWLNSGRYLD